MVVFRRVMRGLAFAATMAGLLAAPVSAKTYEIDIDHSGVTFRIAHMVISMVGGRFSRFKGTVKHVKGMPEFWGVWAEIDAASIDTGVKKRDDHLRSFHFLDVRKYPRIIFKSTKVASVQGDKAKLHGELTLHGITRPIVLDLVIAGEITDLQGRKRIGAVARTKIKRKDFGLTWNKTLDTGGLIVGEEIEIILDIQGIEKNPLRGSRSTAK